MLQIGNRAEILLPGDRAPSLKLARIFNRLNQVTELVLDRLSVVILWNAGCAGCLPLVGEIAAFAKPLHVPCYAVAVLVRDVEATAAAIANLETAAIFALEAPATEPSGLSRGLVTRQWAEASGQPGVPAAFIVGSNGIVLWMGYPSEIKSALPDVRSGSWDVQLARREWAKAVDADDVVRLRLTREITDAVLAGESLLASQIIENAEHQLPLIIEDKQFNFLKLEVLAPIPNSEARALSHYEDAVLRFHDDAPTQLSLATRVIRKLHDSQVAMQAVLNHLRMPNGSHDQGQEQPLIRISRLLLIAEALILFDPDDASRQLESATKLVEGDDFPRNAKGWAQAEIDRIRDRIEAGGRLSR